jgi:hypothetical protein
MINTETIRREMEGEEEPDMVDLVVDLIPALCDEIDMLRAELAKYNASVPSHVILFCAVAGCKEVAEPGTVLCRKHT